MYLNIMRMATVAALVTLSCAMPVDPEDYNNCPPDQWPLRSVDVWHVRSLGGLFKNDPHRVIWRWSLGGTILPELPKDTKVMGISRVMEDILNLDKIHVEMPRTHLPREFWWLALVNRQRSVKFDGQLWHFNLRFHGFSGLYIRPKDMQDIVYQLLQHAKEDQLPANQLTIRLFEEEMNLLRPYTNGLYDEDHPDSYEEFNENLPQRELGKFLGTATLDWQKSAAEGFLERNPQYDPDF